MIPSSVPSHIFVFDRETTPCWDVIISLWSPNRMLSEFGIVVGIVGERIIRASIEISFWCTMCCWMVKTNED